MNDEQGKTISLDRIRYFAEETIKKMSFDIEMYESEVQSKKLPPPSNENYKYMQVGDERISLKGLLYRNKENNEIFDKLICHIINYFIKNKKI